MIDSWNKIATSSPSSQQGTPLCSWRHKISSTCKSKGNRSCRDKSLLRCRKTPCSTSRGVMLSMLTEEASQAETRVQRSRQRIKSTSIRSSSETKRKPTEESTRRLSRCRRPSKRRDTSTEQVSLLLSQASASTRRCKM